MALRVISRRRSASCAENTGKPASKLVIPTASCAPGGVTEISYR